MRALGYWLVAALIGIAGAGCSSAGDVATAEREVGKFHAMVAEQQFGRIYAGTSDDLKRVVSEQDLTRLLEVIRARLGPVKKTERISWRVNWHTSGTFVSLGIKTEFERGTGTEQFVYRMMGAGGELVSYHINSNALITN